MDWKRFAKKNLIPFYNVKDLVSKIQDYGFADGVKDKLKEDYIEDMPIIGNVYDYGKAEGRYIGKCEGYEQASNEYEKKLISQAEEFLKQKISMKADIEKIEELLDEYEKYIQELENKYSNLSRDQLIVLNKLRDMQNKLYRYKFSEKSQEEMIENIQSTIEIQFSKLATEYSLTEEEGIVVCENLNKSIDSSILNDISLSAKPEEYVHMLIENTIESVDKKTSPSTLEYDERGFIKNTARHRNGTKYDGDGYDKYGYDKYGNKKSVLVNEKETKPDLSKYDERGFIKNTAKHKNGTKYDDEGYDKYGYDKNGYNKNGLDKFGHASKIM